MAKKPKEGGFWSDFKAFVSRGNVIDMAVGVVIGGAFGKIVSGLVNYIINPCVSLLTGGVDLDSVKTVLKAGVEADAEKGIEAVNEVAILWGTWIQTIIDFILVALCIFVVIRIISKANARIRAKETAEKAAADAAAAEKASEEKAAADAAAAALAEEQAAVRAAILEIRDSIKKN